MEKDKILDDADYGSCKRGLEYFAADPAWREAFLADPAKALSIFPDISDVYAAFKAVGMMCRAILGDTENPYYGEYIRRYEAAGEYIEERNRAERFADPRLYEWGQIALRRGRLLTKEVRETPHIFYYPLLFELSDGCRVQCPFCGLMAPPHRGDFRATAENRAFWREILAASRRALGEIATDSACYFATEPLDNPDYEILLGDFADCMGNFPQTTTALAAEEPERVRALMKMIGRARMRLAAMRFSVRTMGGFRRIMAEYTPEELADVEILPMNPESGMPISCSGRAKTMPSAGAHERRCYSISCAAGFRVNMVRSTVTFMEPVLPSEEYPTGVHVIAEADFADAEEYEGILRRFIDRYAHDKLPPDVPLRLEPAVQVEEQERYLLLKGNGLEMRLSGNLHIRKAVRRLQGEPVTLPDLWRELGIGSFLGEEARRKLELLYRKGYLRLF